MELSNTLSVCFKQVDIRLKGSFARKCYLGVTCIRLFSRGLSLNYFYKYAYVFFVRREVHHHVNPSNITLFLTHFFQDILTVK